MAIQKFTSTGWQAICVASLIGQCESAVSSGRLTEHAEESMRLLISETLSAFGMTHNNNQEAA
jgi:hypothetical protein